MAPLVESDLALLRAFAVAHPGVQWWLNPVGWTPWRCWT
jgi:hypothetical protein